MTRVKAASGAKRAADVSGGGGPRRNGYCHAPSPEEEAALAFLFAGMSGVGLIVQHLKDSGETSFSNRSAGFDLSRSSPPQRKEAPLKGELSSGVLRQPDD